MYSQLPLFSFMRYQGRFLFLIKKPLIDCVYKEKNLEVFNYLSVKELYSSGLLIGYIFDFKNKDVTYFNNFLAFDNNNKDSGNKKEGRVIFINKYFSVIESEDAQRILIIAENR